MLDANSKGVFQGKIKVSSNAQKTDGYQLSKALLLDKEKGVIENVSDVQGIGHRVVHGGEHFKRPTFVDEKVLSGIEEMIPLL